ncbi:kinase-like domain-containing protein [Apiospora arundinis]
MANPSAQAAGSGDAPANSPGHPAASHKEAYAAGANSLPAADGTKLPFNFSRPDPDFDPNDDSAVKNFYKYQDDARHVLDLRGQQGPTVEEQVENQVKELMKQRKGQEVSKEERETIEQTLRRNAGWLESYKTEVAGTETVPIAAFNHLAHDYEQMQLFMARDRASYEADAIKEIKELEDKLRSQKEGGLEQTGHLDTDSNEFRRRFYELGNDVATKDREIAKLKAELAEYTDASESETSSHRDDKDDKDDSDDDSDGNDGDMKQLRQANDRLQKENEDLKKQVQAADKKSKEAGSQADASSETTKLQKTIKDLKAKLDNQAELTQNSIKEYDTLKRQFQEVDLRNAQLTSEAHKYGVQLAKLQENIASLEAKLEDAEQGQVQKQNQVGNLEKERYQIQTSDKERQKKIDDLERELSTLRRTEQDDKKKISKLEQEVKTIAKSHEDCQARNKELQQQLNGVQGSDSYVKVLQGQLNTAEAKAQKLQKEVGELQTKSSDAETSARDSDENAKKLEREKTETARETQTQLASLRGEVDAAQSVASGYQEMIRELEQNLRGSRASINGLQRRLVAVSGSLDSGNAKITDLEARLREATESQSGAQRVSELEAELQSSTERINDLQQQLAAADHGSLQAANERIHVLEGRLVGALESQGENEARIRELEELNLRRPNGLLGTDPDPQTQPDNDLQAEVRRLRSEMNRVEQQVAELRRPNNDQTIRDLQTELEHTRQDNDDLWLTMRGMLEPY